MKKRVCGILSLTGLTLAFWFIRVPLFDLHGMREWPLCLFMLGAIMIFIFGILFSNKILTMFTAAGYILSFFIGYLFQFDYGVGLNSMWIIWTCSYIAFITVGVVWTLVGRSKMSHR